MAGTSLGVHVLVFESILYEGLGPLPDCTSCLASVDVQFLERTFHTKHIPRALCLTRSSGLVHTLRFLLHQPVSITLE